ncbi:hypothetical protein DSO57_1021579 [Entomophthora muscae]|uniref:Uncharacterized protein n=1 Tax=Entomophthora muscae TaxID=34485 RepID=A0ACC2SSA3_9FUNG|nr:hypothetical protein DSO57_1021579 [Entomophthora muscae]
MFPKIVNFPLETQGQEQDLNSEPDHLQAASPEDQRASCPYFSGIKSPQAEAEPNYQNENTRKNLRATAPKEGPHNLPNGGREIPTVNFMRNKSMQVANQDPLPEENTGLKPSPMTMAQEQKGQVNLPEISTNEWASSSSAILLLLDLGALGT